MYDHISFHIQEHPGLTPEAAVQHMGYYYAWAVSQNLHSTAAAALPQFNDLQQGRLSGSRFILQHLNGGLDQHCFNDLGNRFCRFYYEDEEEGYGRFIEDYFTALDLTNQDNFYRLPDTPENQTKLNTAFQAAFEQWISSLKADNSKI